MDLSTRQTEFAMKFRLTYEEYQKIVKAMTLDEVITCLELLRCVKHRSMYRSRMEKRIREWLVDQRFQKPFRPKEFEILTPKWPIKYQLP